MTITELSVTNQEQTIFLQDGRIVVLRFDMIYKRWFFDLYQGDELLYAGLALNPDTAPLAGITDISVGLIDFSEDKTEYEPYSELGARLGLVEIAND